MGAPIRTAARRGAAALAPAASAPRARHAAIDERSMRGIRALGRAAPRFEKLYEVKASRSF
jgi:hypothetical protein